VANTLVIEKENVGQQDESELTFSFYIIQDIIIIQHIALILPIIVATTS